MNDAISTKATPKFLLNLSLMMLRHLDVGM